MNENLKAFLDMISVSEGTARYPDQGYKTIVGGSQFKSYHNHPRKLVWVEIIGKNSTAAGRYQILMRYYDHYKKQLNLPDFGPDSQDKIAIQLIKECKAYDDIINGEIKIAISKCSSRWASLPGAGYQQPEHGYPFLLAAYQEAGGVLS